MIGLIIEELPIFIDFVVNIVGWWASSPRLRSTGVASNLVDVIMRMFDI